MLASLERFFQQLFSPTEEPDESLWSPSGWSEGVGRTDEVQSMEPAQGGRELRAANDDTQRDPPQRAA